MERRHWANLLSHRRHHVLDDTVVITLRAHFQHQESNRELALQLVGDPDDGTFGDIRMAGEHLLERPRGEAVSGDVDDVVGPGHDEHVAVLIDVARVCGLVEAGELGQVGVDEPIVRLPERWQRRRWHRQPDAQGADFACGELLRVGVEYRQVPSGRRVARRAGNDRQHFDAEAVGHDPPTGLGLPPVVDHRHAELFGRPGQGVWVTAFPGQEQ